jgi:hypothetical protein
MAELSSEDEAELPTRDFAADRLRHDMAAADAAREAQNARRALRRAEAALARARAADLPATVEEGTAQAPASIADDVMMNFLR